MSISWIEFARTAIEDCLKVLHDEDITDSNKIMIITASLHGYDLITQEHVWATCEECEQKVLLTRSCDGPAPVVDKSHKEGCPKNEIH